MMDDRDAFKEQQRKLEDEVAKRYRSLREEVEGRISLLELPDGVTVAKTEVSKRLGMTEWSAVRGDRRLVTLTTLVERVNTRNPIMRLRKNYGRSMDSRHYKRLKDGGWNTDKAIETFTAYIAECSGMIDDEIAVAAEADVWERKMKEVFGDLGALIPDKWARRRSLKFEVGLRVSDSPIPTVYIKNAGSGQVRTNIELPPLAPEEAKRLLVALLDAAKSP